MAETAHARRILGLDVREDAIGWAVLEISGSDGRLDRGRIVAGGVREFPVGVEGSVEYGSDLTPAGRRHFARHRRRQFRRRRERLRRVARILIRNGLLPPELDIGDAGEGCEAWRRFDRRLEADVRADPGWSASDREAAAKCLPHLLRARALDRALKPFELGRALYHLAQHRGFRHIGDPDARLPGGDGPRRALFEETLAEMHRRGAKTIGDLQFMALGAGERARNLAMTRPEAEREFDLIVFEQTRDREGLVPREAREELRTAIFAQRRLTPSAMPRASCELERGQSCAAQSLPLAQRLRSLDQINQVRARDGGGARRLTDQERSRLLAVTEGGEYIGPETMGRLLGLPRPDVGFGESVRLRMLPNLMVRRMRKAIGASWDGLSAAERDAAIEDVRSIRSRDARLRRATGRWKLPREAAERFADVTPEDGRLCVSTKAARRLLPSMERGLSFHEAVRHVYGREDLDDPTRSAASVLARVGNPMLRTVAFELNRLVPAVVAACGRPDEVRAQLGAQLRRGTSDRSARVVRLRALEKARRAAREALMLAGVITPGRPAVERGMLAAEAEWTCPFSGRRIEPGDLGGDAPRFVAVPIVPWERSLDRSLANLVICEAEFASRLAKETPWSGLKTWSDISARLAKLPGLKAERCLQEPGERAIELDRGERRDESETSWASRKLVHIVRGLLGEGPVVPVQVRGGRATRALREIWRVRDAMPPAPSLPAPDPNFRRAQAESARVPKDRSRAEDDLRWRTARAVVVGLAGAGTCERLRTAPVTVRSLPPWPEFAGDLRAALALVVPSRRARRRVRGGLHGQIFHREIVDLGSLHKRAYTCRKNLMDLSKAEVERIVDPAVRRVVVVALAGRNPATAFAPGQPLPEFPGRSGASRFVRRVRVQVREVGFSVGSGIRERHVLNQENHSIEMWEEPDGSWSANVVPGIEAIRRLRHPPPGRRTTPGGRRFLFSVSAGDLLELDTRDGGRSLFRVSRFTTGFTRFGQPRPRLFLVPLCEARGGDEALGAGRLLGKNPEPLHNLRARKVTVDRIGRVRPAGD